jgi:hypothetical protein
VQQPWLQYPNVSLSVGTHGPKSAAQATRLYIIDCKTQSSATDILSLASKSGRRFSGRLSTSFEDVKPIERLATADIMQYESVTPVRGGSESGG